MFYKASLDTLSKYITLFCFLLFVGVGYLNIIPLTENGVPLSQIIVHVSVLFLIWAIFLTCYFIAPVGYQLDQTALTIVRRVKSVYIDLTQIQSVSLVDKSDLSFLIRTFAVGGLFGYFGRYYSSSIGVVYLYTTQRKNRILIIRKNGTKLIISPDDLTFFTKLNEAFYRITNNDFGNALKM